MTGMRPNRARALHTAACAVLALLWLPGAKNGCGSEEANETFSSPVQGVTTLLERSDGTVDAELVLISTARSPHRFVDTATDVRLRVPSGDMVTLSLATPGHYAASSASNSALVYEPGASYRFSFELDDEDLAKDVSGGDFFAVTDAPDDQVSFTVTPPEFAGAPSTIEWQPSSRYGLYRIYDVNSGEQTYANFDFQEPQFEGDKWARIRNGGKYDLNANVFADAGDYRVEFCAVKKVSDFDVNLSAQLGALSGFLIGRCAPDQTITVIE